MVAALFLSAGSLSGGALIDNNAGIWTDLYSDSLSVVVFDQTEVDLASGTVRLVAGESTGSFRTVTISPSSFDAWEAVTLGGTWSSSADVRVTLLDPNDGDAPISGFQNMPYAGPIDLSGLDVGTYPDIRLEIDLSESVAAPQISSATVSWDPASELLVANSAPSEVNAGQLLSYRVRYSVNFVEAQDVVVWEQLPGDLRGTVIYPEDYGQSDNPSFFSATDGGVYTATATTVRGVSIPADSVYWDLGTVPEGSSDTLAYFIRPPNGTLDGTEFRALANGAASNAPSVSSALSSTTVRAAPNPSIKKTGGDGIFKLPSGNFTEPGSANHFEVRASNPPIGEGDETLFDVVVYDDLTDLLARINPGFGGSGVPVAGISEGGVYNANYVPPSGGAPFPAVVWEIDSIAPGDAFSGTFSVELLDSPPLPTTDGYTNTASIESRRTPTPVQTDLQVRWPLDESPTGLFAFGDNLDLDFEINADTDDDFDLYVEPGGVVPFGLSVRNNGLVALNDIVMLSKVPDDTNFKSVWFDDPWLRDNARIFYSTTDTVDADTPPAIDATQLPGDLDPAGNANWEDLASNPPGNPSSVRWVAVHIPAINSPSLDSSSSGWVSGAPTSARFYYDVNIPIDALDPTPCDDKIVSSRALFFGYGYTPLSGGAVQPTNISGTDDEFTVIATDKPEFAFSGDATVTPEILFEAGEVTYATSVQNTGAAIAQDVKVELSWPEVEVNGTPQHLSLVGVSPGSIDSFDLANGRITVSLGNLPPGVQVPLSLTVEVPQGTEFGAQLNFTSRVTAEGGICSVPAVTNQASGTVQTRPSLRVFKNDVIDIINSGGETEYILRVSNTGDTPSTGTWLVDRVPQATVFLEASAPRGESVWFAPEGSALPGFLSPSSPLDADDIAANFSPGTRDDGGTPADPSDDSWTSPFGDQTAWVAWQLDLPVASPPIFPAGQISEVGMRVRNDDDGSGPSTDGSPRGTEIFNSAATFSDQLLQTIGNEVSSVVNTAPSIIVQKSGPGVVAAGETFDWTVDYFNNSGTASGTVTVVDTLPPGIEYLGSTHEWNRVALDNGAPVDNNGQPVATEVTNNPDGSTTVRYEIAGPSGYRGDGASLGTLEGGALTLSVRTAAGTPSDVDFINQVTGEAVNAGITSISSDQNLVQVRNAELGLNKFRDDPNPVAGDVVTYSLVVRNTGLKEATNVVLSDTLPANMAYESGSAFVLAPGYSIGSPAIIGNQLIWSAARGNALTRAPLAPGVIPSGSGDILVQYRARVLAGTGAGTTLTNSASVRTDTPEDGTLPNEDSRDVLVPYPDPVVIKLGPRFVEPGTRFNYQISYFNNTRQEGTGVYLVDTLPDYDGDGETDLTFIGQTAPPGVIPYYSDAPSGAAPAFDPSDPTANGWSATPTSPVNHIAWLVGTLPGDGSISDIFVTVEGFRPNGGAPVILPAGIFLENRVVIDLDGTDQNPDNNEAVQTTATPGNDIALTKTGSTEGAFPGLSPGEALGYTIEVVNSGSQIAYGISIEDSIPPELTLESPIDDFVTLELEDANGNPVDAVDPGGSAIVDPIPITRLASGNDLEWLVGSNNSSDPLFFRNIGIPPGARFSFTVNTRVGASVGNGASISNTATAVLSNQDDTAPPELVLANNTDTTLVNVFLADAAVRKSVVNLSSGSLSDLDAGDQLRYTIGYNNLGFANGLNTVIEEIVPEGTSLVAVDAPAGATVRYAPGPGSSDAEAFAIDLGILNAPANSAGLIKPFEVATAVRLENGANGIPAGTFAGFDDPFRPSADRAGQTVVSPGDVDGDGLDDLILYSDFHETSSGPGVYVMFMNADGTVRTFTELRQGVNGVASDGFAGVGVPVRSDFGEILTPGDFDGDGVPDLIMTNGRGDAAGPNSNSGAAMVILLNADGSAKSVVRLVNGENGIPVDGFVENASAGESAAVLGDVDGNGVPDILLDAPRLSTPDNFLTGGAHLILLNADGTAKDFVVWARGLNGIPNSFSNRFDTGIVGAPGDLDGDGVPDAYLSGRFLLLNSDGTVKSIIQPGFAEIDDPNDPLDNSSFFSGPPRSIGDLDGDGVPDLVVGTPEVSIENSNEGGIKIFLMNSNGGIKRAISLRNGLNGIPSGTFKEFTQAGAPIHVPGDMDGDGLTDLLVTGPNPTNNFGVRPMVWAVFLNADGTAKNVVSLSSGENGVPEEAYLSFDDNQNPFFPLTTLNDLNGNGVPEIVIGLPYADEGPEQLAGGAWIFLPEFANNGLAPIQGVNVVDGELTAEVPLGGAEAPSIKLANGLNGIPSDAWPDPDSRTELGREIEVADIDGDGIDDFIFGTPDYDETRFTAASDVGGFVVMLMNGDGTAKSTQFFTNGFNDIPAEFFESDEQLGHSLAVAGDIDGNGVPDLVLGAPGNETGMTGNFFPTGAVWVFLMGQDGRPIDTIKLANGVNGIAPGSFADRDEFGYEVRALGDLNGDSIPDIAVGGLEAEAVWIVFLEADGRADSVVELSNGSGGIPSNTTASVSFGRFFTTIDDLDVDGNVALLVGSPFNDTGGGAWIIFLNGNGTARDIVELSNGLNGIPAGIFLDNARVGSRLIPIDDLDGDGISEIVIAGNSGLWVMFLQANGTVKPNGTVELANGLNGVPEALFPRGVVDSLITPGDIDGDGNQDLMVGKGSGADVLLLNSNGTVKSTVSISEGKNGIPEGTFRAGESLAPLGDFDGDGLLEVLFGAPRNRTPTGASGGAFLISLSEGFLHSTGRVERRLPANDGLSTWDRLFSTAEVPDGTSLTYSLGRLVNGQPVYDLGPAFTDIEGPLPEDGFDLSSLTEPTLVARVDFATTRPAAPDFLTPTMRSLFATYRSDVWPELTFTVQVEDPLPFDQRAINNTVEIFTDSPELRSDNNQASANMDVLLTDLAVRKSVSQSSVNPGDSVTFTLEWENLGPQAALSAVLTDTLPAGFTYDSASVAPDAVSGQQLTWNLGDLAVAANGRIDVEVTVDAGTAAGTYLNAARASNDRQDSDVLNNEDNVTVVVVPIGNPLPADVAIDKSGPAEAILGETILYTLDYANNGGGAATDVVVTDTLPAGLSFVSATPAPSTTSGSTLTWEFTSLGLGSPAGTLGSGDAGTITIEAQVGNNYAALDGQSVVNVATIASSSSDVNRLDNEDSAATVLSGLPAAIGGRVWNDGNENGSIDPSESFVPDVIITLTGTDVLNNEVTATQLTDADGRYTFSGLVPGTYTLTQTQPAGFATVTDVLGTVTLSGGTPPGATRGSNADPLDNQLTGIALNSNERGTGYNFAELAPAVVSGRVYYDTNGNGVPDTGESGVPGLDLLVTDRDGAEQTVTTNSSGNWTVEVPQGTTTIDIDEDDPQYPVDIPKTQGDDPTVVEAISNTTVSGGLDGFFLNLDRDNDGIPDSVEIANACVADGDTDGDGVPDHLDRDSDGDGIFDLVEAGLGDFDSDGDGQMDGPRGINGLADVVETSADSGEINYTLPDSDGDGRPDHLDLDSDNDSIGDVLESGNGFLTDMENDGIADGVVDANGLVPDAGRFNPVDTDSDGIPDYLDLDSNEDGFFDITDNGFSILDPDGDGRIDDDASPDDCDGIPDVLDPRPEEYGWFPETGCVAWNANNDDSDGDVFPAVHEYAFGTDPTVGDHTVIGTDRQAGLVVEENADGGIDITYVIPPGRYDVTYEPYIATAIGSDFTSWFQLSFLKPQADEIVVNEDGTQTVVWRNVDEPFGGFLADSGAVRLLVSTPCDPSGTSTLVQGWSRQTIAGKYQTYGWNYNSLAIFSGYIDAVSGNSLTTHTSGGGLDLGSLLPEGVASYLEVTSGPHEGHRFEIAGGRVDGFELDLSSPRNTLDTLPTDLAGSHFILRPHVTLGDIYPNEDWNAATSPGSADQVLLYNGVGYETYYNLAIGSQWVRQGSGFDSRNAEPVPPGVGMMVVRSAEETTNSILSIGAVRNNAFRQPVETGSTGLNFIANAFPLDLSPLNLLLYESEGFAADPNLGLSTQILEWRGNTDPGTTGWTRYYQPSDQDWQLFGSPGFSRLNSPLFQQNRAVHLKVRDDQPDWTHAKPWNDQFWFPAGWQQPSVESVRD